MEQLCFECGMLADFNHHVIPRSLGGTKTVPLCIKCHEEIHKTSLSRRELTKQSLVKLQKMGRRTGSVPFGYSVNDNGFLVENENEQNIICIVKRLRSEYKLSLRIIGQKLYCHGLRSRNGNVFDPSQVRRMINSVTRVCITHRDE